MEGKNGQAASNALGARLRYPNFPQAVVNLFSRWYADLGFSGCSSHSGRRTFITNAARKISTVGGSLRDIQALAGHSNLSTTQRYIESHAEAQRKVVELV
jgi:integrase/recombinase XerD